MTEGARQPGYRKRGCGGGGEHLVDATDSTGLSVFAWTRDHKNHTALFSQGRTLVAHYSLLLHT